MNMRFIFFANVVGAVWDIPMEFAPLHKIDCLLNGNETACVALTERFSNLSRFVNEDFNVTLEHSRARIASLVQHRWMFGLITPTPDIPIIVNVSGNSSVLERIAEELATIQFGEVFYRQIREFSFAAQLFEFWDCYLSPTCRLLRLRMLLQRVFQLGTRLKQFHSLCVDDENVRRLQAPLPSHELKDAVWDACHNVTRAAILLEAQPRPPVSHLFSRALRFTSLSHALANFPIEFWPLMTIKCQNVSTHPSCLMLLDVFSDLTGHEDEDPVIQYTLLDADDVIDRFSLAMSYIDLDKTRALLASSVKAHEVQESLMSLGYRARWTNQLIYTAFHDAPTVLDFAVLFEYMSGKRMSPAKMFWSSYFNASSSEEIGDSIETHVSNMVKEDHLNRVLGFICDQSPPESLVGAVTRRIIDTCASYPATVDAILGLYDEPDRESILAALDTWRTGPGELLTVLADLMGFTMDDPADSIKSVLSDLTITGNSTDDCPICLKAIPHTHVQLMCRHSYCCHCIEEWLISQSSNNPNGSCPLCRSRVLP